MPNADREPRYLSTADEVRIREAVATATNYALGQPDKVVRDARSPSRSKPCVGCRCSGGVMGADDRLPLSRVLLPGVHGALKRRGTVRRDGRQYRA